MYDEGRSMQQAEQDVRIPSGVRGTATGATTPGRGEKIVLGGMVTFFAAVAAYLVAHGFQKTVEMSVVGVRPGPDGLRISQVFRVPVEVSAHCDPLRAAYVTAVQNALKAAGPAATVADLTPTQVRDVVLARAALGDPSEAGAVRGVVSLTGQEPAAVLAPQMSAPGNSWYGIRFGK